MARYKIVAHLIDPSLQDETTLTKEYLRDWEIIEKGGKEAMKLLYSKYPIDSNAYENFNSTMKYKLEQDADGIYLFKRCDDMIESKYKQTVKLNEAQLRQIVAESVKNILSELDWKTYANARHKAADKGQYNRSLKFGNAAEKEFNDKYAFQGDEESEYAAPNVRGDIFLNRVEAKSDSYPSHTLMRMYDYDGKGNYSNPHDYDSTKAFGLLDKYDDEGRYKRVKNPSLKRFFNNTEQEKAYRNASKEMDDYVMGNYDYDKEKGWHVKESVEKAVNTVLKEYFNKKK